MLRDFVNSALEKKNTIMLLTSLAFIIGIASYFNNCELLFAFVGTVLCVLFVIRNKISYKIILLWVFVFYFGFFNAFFRIKLSDELTQYAPANVTIEGRIVSIPNSNLSDKTKFFLEVDKVDNQNIKAKTFVNILDENGDFKDFKIGDKYKIKGNLRTPFKASNPSQFDYGKYLRNFKTFTVLYADKQNCELLKADLPLYWKFLQNLNNTRGNIIDVHSQFLGSPNLEILGGIVFGDDAVAPPDYIKDSFVNSGLLHILAASGMNVAFIFGFWFYLLSFFRVPYRIRVVTGMGVVVLYTLMTGLGASVIRASLMLLFVLAGKLIDRDSHSIALLSFVAFLMLAYNPALINDVGFQLSFLVTFGIICTAGVLMEKYRENKLQEILMGAIVVPIVAQIWVIPIQMFYFNTISLYSFFANISTMPFLSLVSCGGFVSSILAPIPFVGKYICGFVDYFMNIFLNIIVWISNFFGGLPSSLLEVSHPSIAQIALYYLIVLLVTLMIKEGFSKRHIALAGLVIGILFVSTVNIPNGKLEVIAFDVGNADSFLVKTPQDKYIVIDTGKVGYHGGKSQAELIVRKYLKDKGLKNIELMIVTHFDSDHSGGAKDLISNMKVRKVLVNSINDNSKMAKAIYKVAKLKSVNLEKAPDDVIAYEEPNLKLTTYTAELSSDNESSVISLLSYGDFEMLFTGDAGVEGFRRIADKMPSEVEVLKVGHHGAKNVVDSNYVDRINPVVSLISVGKNNYGHPNKMTLEVLRDTEIYRTDENNSIKIVTDGENYQMFSYSIKNKKYELISSKLAK